MSALVPDDRFDTDEFCGELKTLEGDDLIDRVRDLATAYDDLAAELDDVRAERDEADELLANADTEAFETLRSVRDWLDEVLLMRQVPRNPMALLRMVERAIDGL